MSTSSKCPCCGFTLVVTGTRDSELIRAAFLAGFCASAEGFNGEYVKGNVHSVEQILSDVDYQDLLRQYMAGPK